MINMYIYVYIRPFCSARLPNVLIWITIVKVTEYMTFSLSLFRELTLFECQNYMNFFHRAP